MRRCPVRRSVGGLLSKAFDVWCSCAATVFHLIISCFEYQTVELKICQQNDKDFGNNLRSGKWEAMCCLQSARAPQSHDAICTASEFAGLQFGGDVHGIGCA